MLMEVLNDGQELLLMDGTKWMINPGDIPSVCTWIPTAKIKVEKLDINDMFFYKLTNLNVDISVYAMKIN